jgi:hypothetical protein
MFQLRHGEKPNIDKLGRAYANLDPKTIVTFPIWERAARVARQTYFRDGYGLPSLTTADVEVRIYPQQHRIAFCWGMHVGGKIIITANVYRYDVPTKLALEQRGLIPRMH